MLRGQPNSLDEVVNKLDYTFIDLPDLIDASEEFVEPESTYTQSVYALEAPATSDASQQRHQQHKQQTAGQSNAAVAGSYWQQLQHCSSLKQSSGQVFGIGPVPGGLGASLAGATQLHQQQYGHQHVEQHGQHVSHQIAPTWLMQVQQQQQISQQIGASQPPSTSHVAPAAAAAAAAAQGAMEEG